MKEVFRPVEAKLSRVLKQIGELEKAILDYSTQNLVEVECALNDKRLGYAIWRVHS